jgi:hypothetical protein
MNKDKSWLILPFLSFNINEDGTKEIKIGWWRRLYVLTFNQNKCFECGENKGQSWYEGQSGINGIDEFFNQNK